MAGGEELFGNNHNVITSSAPAFNAWILFRVKSPFSSVLKTQVSMDKSALHIPAYTALGLSHLPFQFRPKSSGESKSSSLIMFNAGDHALT